VDSRANLFPGSNVGPGQFLAVAMTPRTRSSSKEIIMFSIIAFLVGFPPVLHMATPLYKGECGPSHEQCAVYQAEDGGYLLALYDRDIVRKVVWVSKKDPTIQRDIYINPKYLH
jgi:hypothetical protein